VDLFTNRKPTPEQEKALDTITNGMHYAWESILLVLPPSAERTLAQRKLEECSMWAKKAAVFTIEPINAPAA
jgi:hypothetical protein